MALKTKFICIRDKSDHLELDSNQEKNEIFVEGIFDKSKVEFIFDKTTAIKFAKTLRTEINKIQ